LGCIAIFENFTEFNFYSLLGSYDSGLSGVLSHASRGNDIRISGPFDHAIAYGAYFSLMLPLFLYKFNNRFLWLLFWMVFFIYIGLQTQSRAAQIGYVISITYYVLFIEKRKYLFLLILPIPFLSGSFRYSLSTLNPFFSGDEVLEQSSEARVNQLYFLFDYIKRNLVFGYGMVEPPAMMRWIGNYHNTVDNYYLLYTFYYGISGLITWLFLIITIFYKSFKIYAKFYFSDSLIQMLIVGILTFCVINLVVALWSFHFVFWLYAGIITRLLVIKMEEKKINK